MKKNAAPNQKSRKEIRKILVGLNIHKLWDAALLGNEQAQRKLTELSLENKEIYEALQHLRPRRSMKPRRGKVRDETAMMKGSIYSVGWVSFYGGYKD